MDFKIRKAWLQLYEVAQKIKNMSPWDKFTEDDKFAFVLPDRSATLLFSFIFDSLGRYAIACYKSENEYAKARYNLTKSNPDIDEPLFLLQNALICIWDDRQDISDEDYKIIKELGFKFHGDGKWLHFNKYEVGCFERTPSDVEVLNFLDALGNLHMMLRAIFDNGLDPEFDKGHILIRWYEPSTRLFYTHPFKVDTPFLPTYPRFIAMKNETIKKLAAKPSKPYSIDIDSTFAYCPGEQKDGKCFLSRKLLFADTKTYAVFDADIFSASSNVGAEIIYRLNKITESEGKPRAINVIDEETYAILEDYCKKTGIKLNLTKSSKAINHARKLFFDFYASRNDFTH